MIISCDIMDNDAAKYRKIALKWQRRKIILPTELPCKVIGFDTIFSSATTKKYKIFTYIDTVGCTECNFGALAWKQLIDQMDTLSSDVVFLFYAHLKNYREFETYLKMNKFNHPIFYDYFDECKKNQLPQHVFYQTFLLDENNKVLLIGKPKPDSKLWNLYKKIITQ